jgi:hypothetical protein
VFVPFVASRRFDRLFIALPRTKPAILVATTVPAVRVPAKARLRIREQQIAVESSASILSKQHAKKRNGAHEEPQVCRCDRGV